MKIISSPHEVIIDFSNSLTLTKNDAGITFDNSGGEPYIKFHIIGGHIIGKRGGFRGKIRRSLTALRYIWTSKEDAKTKIGTL